MFLHQPHRRGSILPLVAVSLIALFSLVALAIDLGLVALARTQCQNAADIAAMAAVRELNGDTTNNNNYTQAQPTAKTVAAANQVLSNPVDPATVTATVGYYAYNTTAKRFEANFSGTKPASENWSAVQVDVSATTPMFFARVFGQLSKPASATATAVHRPRDIAIILDYSGSMRFSTLNAYPYSGNKSGSLNPDPDYPQFGHWSSLSNVLYKDTSYVDSSGQVFAPSNITADTQNGQAIVNDFLMRDSANNLTNAFVRSSGSYNPTVWAVPAPSDWKIQADTTVKYGGASGKGGDYWPRFSGSFTSGSYAHTVQEFLFGNNTTQSNTHAKSTVTGPSGGKFDPVTASSPADNEGYGSNFKGYSMGPGWYGKTFYMWPPDPRFTSGANPSSPDTTSSPPKDTGGKLICDWRQRFFYKKGTTTPANDNSVLWDSTGNWKQAGQTGNYDVNYTAVIQWIKSGAPVLPANLRAGRVLYYSAIPDSIPSSGGTADQRFWRGYIDYVIGSGSSSTQSQSLYGRNSSGWGTVRITAKSSVTGPDNTAGTSDDPYMHYNDNPIRPRLHFWFGPLTLLDFISRYSNNWLPGTAHESQTWQLKAGIQSALNDIEKNHPNDWVALMYFSTESDFTTARVSLGREYDKMKNALFFPYSLLDSLGDPFAEIRPYQNNDSLTWDNPGNIPAATGGTAPEMAFKVAYNQFSDRTGYNGRRGATKMLIFETDGVPNNTAAGNFTNAGAYQSYYSVTGATTSYGNNNPTVTSAALDVIQTICNLETHPTKPGYATSKNPVRVHALGFGDLFQTDSTSKTDALDFLLQVQKKGNTSSASATSIESYKIITGDYNTRIENLREALERIMQSGIQVSLIR
jgi:Flp pilus assembly protein TadG